MEKDMVRLDQSQITIALAAVVKFVGPKNVPEGFDNDGVIGPLGQELIYKAIDSFVTTDLMAKYELSDVLAGLGLVRQGHLVGLLLKGQLEQLLGNSEAARADRRAVIRAVSS